MATYRGVKTIIDNFDYAFSGGTTPGMNGWTIKDTSSAGTPTYVTATEDGGSFVATLASTSEAEIVTLYQNDILMLDLAKLHQVWWIAKVSGIDSVTDLVLGVGSAQNDTEDSVATAAWFKIDGSASTSNLLAETDDGTNDNSVTTATSLSSTYKKLLIDFSSGLSDVRFFIDGTRVASGTTFDMSDVSAGTNVQPFMQLHKASGTGVGAVTLFQFGAVYEWTTG